MGEFHNVNQKGEILTNSNNVIITRDRLLNEFEKFIFDSGFEIVKWLSKKSPFEIIIKKHKEYHLYCYIKCISGAGWADKPWIKRVQVSNIKKDDLDKYIDTTSTETNIIFGLYFFDDSVCLVGWNLYKYTMHATARSCYVNVETLQKGIKNGYFVGEVSNQKIWVSKPEFFQKMLDDYIKFNTI